MIYMMHVYPYTRQCIEHYSIYTWQQKKRIFSISISYQKPLSILFLNDMNMFDRTHSFVLNHLIRHYTVNNIFLLINAKNAKTAPYIGKHRIWIPFHCMSPEHTVTDK